MIIYRYNINQQQTSKQVKKTFGFLVGQTMKAAKGQGNPKLVNEVLRKILSE